MLTLYEHPFALYCQQVLVAFNEQGVAYGVAEAQLTRTEFLAGETFTIADCAAAPVNRAQAQASV